MVRTLTSSATAQYLCGKPLALVLMKTAFYLLRYLRPHWRGLVLVLITLVLASGLTALRPWPTKILVDQVLGEEPLPQELRQVLTILPGPDGVTGLLLWVCLSTVIIYLAGALLSMLSSAVSVTFGQKMVFDLGADLFNHVQRLSLLYHSKRSLGDLVSRITVDSYCLQILIGSTLLPVIQSLLTLAIMFVVMWQLEPTMTLVALAVVPFLGLLIYAFGKPMKVRNRVRRDLEGRMMSLVEQTLSAIPAVQAFTREEVENERFRGFADETVTAYRKSIFVDAWFKLLVGLVTVLGTAGIMWLGAQYVLQGKITVGTVLVFLAYLASLYQPLNAIVYTTSLVQAAAANGDRVMEVFNSPTDVKEAPDACQVQLCGHIHLDAVTFGYELEPVLKDINLEVQPGEVIAIVGPTGAGKTTLVNLLLRFFDPWNGRVLADGHDLRKLKIKSLRRQIGIVLQEPFLLPLTVAQNIAYGRPEATREEIVAAASTANAHEFISRLPEGYDTIIGERGATLSGGEKQRLAIARAVLKDAPILILDEPTSSVDARTEFLLLEALDRLMAGRTTFIIAHRLSTIRNAGRIVVLENGEIVEEGLHSELMELGGLYADLYRQQMAMGNGSQLSEEWSSLDTVIDH